MLEFKMLNVLIVEPEITLATPFEIPTSFSFDSI